MTDMREIGPTYYFAPPRVFENLLTQVMIRMEDAAAIKRWLFHTFMGVARRCGAECSMASRLRLTDRLLYRLGNLLVYGPLRNVLGMSRIRVAYTAGAAIGPGSVPLLSFDRHQSQAVLRSDRNLRLRVPAAERRDQARLGRQAATRCRGPLAEQGEIWSRARHAQGAYYKRPDATAESIDRTATS
jgi:long-chain acyl-CoA synthetase